MSHWTQFLVDIDQARHELKCDNSGAWFRGASHIKHGLVPKLIWKHARPDAEKNLFKAFQCTHHRERRESSWLDLIDMQHYGTATRLLDWTEVLGVALYFALSVSRADETTTPCVWVLNPFTLATRSRGSNDKSIADFHLDSEMDYYRRFIKTNDWPYKFPMPFYCPAPNDRIRAQRGFFTVHGTDNRSLHTTCEKHVRCVPIPREVIPEADRFLNHAGIDDYFIYPDQFGWLSKIDREYFYSELHPHTSDQDPIHNG